MQAETENILQLLKRVIDPEIGLNIVDLGLVYQVEMPQAKQIKVTMTLTTPGCPMGQTISNAVTSLLESHYPGFSIAVELAWFPRWAPEMISKEGQAQLHGGDHGLEDLWDRFW
jgi:metal-sulfur cluster biosynthetic enzyme